MTQSPEEGAIIFSFADGDLGEYGPARLVAFAIAGSATTPEQFARAVAQAPRDQFIPPGRGIIFTGRGPIWGYAMLCHASHPTLWIAVHDPRLGVVVVQSHRPGLAVGQIIPLSIVEPLLQSATSAQGEA